MGLFELVITLYIGAMTYLANLADLHLQNQQSTDSSMFASDTPYVTAVRRMLFALVVMVVLFGLYANQILTLELPAGTLEELGINPQAISMSSLLVISLLVLALCGLCFVLITSPTMRMRVKWLTGKNVGYNPNSQVHLVAMVLALCLISYLAVSFVLAGGLQGVADAIEENGISLTMLFFQGTMFVLIALLGVGLVIRRTPQQTLDRLGMGRPTARQVLGGLVAGFVFIGISLLLTALWATLVTPEQYAQQSAAAAEISSQINSVQSVLVLSLVAAVSEEILFRGALQPIFGIPLTTLLFVIFHNQYTLTPAMLIILSIGLGLALLRRYHGTVSAIIAHFIYNFIPILIVIAWPQMAHMLGLSS